MKTIVKLTLLVISVLLLSGSSTAQATVRYVDVNGVNPAPPYTNWATAAATIQEAVDAADGGDEVVVTNGTYASGGRAVYGTMTNRVAVDKPLAVRSVNGPQHTIIQGRQVPGSTNGDGAIRCVYLTNGASLAGFTLTNGATLDSGDHRRERSGGGVFSESAATLVSGCVIAGNAALVWGGGAYSGTLSNCTFNANSALASGTYGGAGGGAFYSTLNNCALSNNSAGWAGGGAAGGTLNHCALVNNRASSGGGAAGAGVALPACTINYCTLAGNWAAQSGGGVYGERPYGPPLTLNACTLISNSAPFGGGAYEAVLNNCLLRTNLAEYGGGANACDLNNCTLTDNFASIAGGGASANVFGFTSTLNNCILYFNSAPQGTNYSLAYGPLVLNYCWTTPDSIVFPNEGEPLFVDHFSGNLRLQSNSPCINAGYNAYAVGSGDLDGRPRVAGGTVDIGAYEFQGAGMGEFVGWLQQHGLPTDGSADGIDSDSDGRNNWQEWRCLTDPTNALSVLQLLPLSFDGTNAVLRWESVAGVNYFLECGTNSAANPAFSVLATNLQTQQSGMRTYYDTNTADAPIRVYRLGVGP